MNVAIACDPQRSVVVEACAGSGKTWLLTARILRCLLQGTPPRAILALTYTNKAAAEMQSRLWRELEQLALQGSEQQLQTLQSWGLSGTALAQARQQAPHAYERLLVADERPTIGTFHSWYTRLLAMAPVSVASLSSLRVTSRPHQFRRAVWQRFENSLQAAEGLSLPLLLGELGMVNFRAALKDLMSLRGMLGALDFDWNLAEQQGQGALARAQAQTTQLQTEWFSQEAPLAAELFEAFRALGDRPEATAVLQNWGLDQARAFSDIFLSKPQHDDPDQPRQHLRARLLTKTQQAVWGGRAPELLEKVRGLCSRFVDLMETINGHWAKAVEQSLLACGGLMLRASREVSQERDETDFDGLELAALELIRSEPGLALLSRLDCRVEQILVDECQDTNAVQWTILRSWLEAHTAAHGPDAKAPSVFLVGDPKQSIYRFRGADPRVFQTAQEWLVNHYEAVVETTDLTRRCAPSLVAFMNRSLLPLAPHRYRPHQSLSTQSAGAVMRLSARTKAKGGSKASTTDEPRDWLAQPDGEAVDSAWLLEGQAIATALQALRESDPLLQWQDMRVLVRARTHLADYERAFAQAGLPFISDRTDGLLQSAEVEDLLNLCRWLAFPWSNADLASLLKSPLLAWSDEQVLDLASRAQAAQTSWWTCLSLGAGESDPLVQRLRAWQGWASELPVHDLLNRILSQLSSWGRLARAYGPQQRARQVVANWQAFLAWCLQWDAGRQPGVARFIQEVDELLASPEAELPGPGFDDSGVCAVRLQSLHSAKGLESKVVVLAGLADREQSDKGVLWLVQADPSYTQLQTIRAHRKKDPLDPVLRDLLKERDRLSNQEDFNLLYVGMTRAKTHLIISAAGSKTESWYDHLEQFSPDADQWVAYD